MNNKSVCVFRQVVCFVTGLALALTVFMGGIAQAQAAPGFTTLNDVQSEVQHNKAETAKEKIKKVLLGITLTFSPQEFAQAIKQFALDQIRNKILEKTGLNIVISSKNQVKTIMDTSKNIGDTIAAGHQAEMQHSAHLVDTQKLAMVKIAEAQIAANNTPGDAESSGALSCIDYEQSKQSSQGGVAGQIQGRTTPIKRATYSVLSRGARDPQTGKFVPPTATETTAAAMDTSTGAMSQGSSSSTGGPNWQGPAQQRRDQAMSFVKMYACKEDYGGNAGAVGIDCSDRNKHALDTRAADLLPHQGQALSLVCFKEAAKGGYVLDGFDAAFCGDKEQNYWDSLVAKGKDYQEGDKIWRPTIDLSTAIVIRDYMLPSGVTSFSKKFLEAMKNNNAGTQEVFAKRQAYENSKNLVAGIFNQRIAELMPQKIGDAETTETTGADGTVESPQARFEKYWSVVYPTTPPPPLPSQKARRDVEIEIMRTPWYVENKINTITSYGAAQKTELAMLGRMAGTQKDIQYSLERIEVLLATMLSNDLQARRTDVEKSVKEANDQFEKSGK